MSSQTESLPDPPRRSFFTQLVAAVMGLTALAAPTLAGLAVVLDPLRKRGKADDGEGNWIRVASLEQIPADGKPHPFPVVEAEPRDKWNLYEPQSVGAVFLTRTGDGEQVEAISSICPHLGCAVSFDASRDRIVCPCHNGVFDPSGKQTDGSTVSPRDLDPLETKVDSTTGDVLVNYHRFKGGIAEREVV